MALRIRYQHASGSSLGYSIERLSDGSFFDFAASAFSTSPATPISPLPEDTGIFVGRYKVTMSPTPAAQFTDGDFAITVHDLVANNVAGQLGVTMHSGDDATVFQTAAGGVDPWSMSLPGSYAPGSAGAILGQNLDAQVSTRSTFAGGAVASVTGPVTVGTNADKQGYSLAQTGLDSIVVESGINARQALSPILAASAGVVTGAGTGTIVIRGANVTTSRITATTDNAGNRSAVNLSLPT